MTRDELLTMPAGRELDRLVAEKVMGQMWQGGSPIPNYDGRWPWPPPYSTDIAAAWLVANKLGERWFVDIGCLPGDCAGNPNPKWEARFWDAEPCISGGVGHVSGLEEFKARGETAPLAICRAALAVP